MATEQKNNLTVIPTPPADEFADMDRLLREARAKGRAAAQAFLAEVEDLADKAEKLARAEATALGVREHTRVFAIQLRDRADSLRAIIAKSTG